MRKGKCRELEPVIAAITRLLASEESELVHDRALSVALQKLETAAKGGRPIPRKRLVKIVEVIVDSVRRAFLKLKNDAAN